MKTTIKNTLLVLVLCFPVLSFSQSDLMLYGFDAIGQSLHVNPATRQQSRVWIGLPGISNSSFYYQNNTFALKDILTEGTDINQNLFDVASSMDENSLLGMGGDIDLLSVGFKAGNSFISFGSNMTYDYSMTLPPDLFRLLFSQDGTSLSNFSLQTFNLEVLVRANYWFGYQRSFMNDRLSLGARFKYITGIGHVDMENFDVYVESSVSRDEGSDDFYTRLIGDLRARTSGTTGYDEVTDDIVGNLFSSNNGFGLDLGFDYKLSKRLSLSASVLDLGYIDWQDRTQDFVVDGEFEWTGVQIDLANTDGLDDAYAGIADSIETAFQPDTIEGSAYTTNLTSRVFASVSYDLTPKHTLSAIYHTRTWKGRVLTDYGIKYYGRLFRGFQITGGYTIINNTYFNIGAGFDLKLGPLQLFVLSENIFGAVNYAELYSTNVRVGLNITLYQPKEKPKAIENN